MEKEKSQNTVQGAATAPVPFPAVEPESENTNIIKLRKPFTFGATPISELDMSFLDNLSQRHLEVAHKTATQNNPTSFVVNNDPVYIRSIVAQGTGIPDACLQSMNAKDWTKVQAAVTAFLTSED